MSSLSGSAARLSKFPCVMCVYVRVCACICVYVRVYMYMYSNWQLSYIAAKVAKDSKEAKVA